MPTHTSGSLRAEIKSLARSVSTIRANLEQRADALEAVAERLEELAGDASDVEVWVNKTTRSWHSVEKPCRNAPQPDPANTSPHINPDNFDLKLRIDVEDRDRCGFCGRYV